MRRALARMSFSVAAAALAACAAPPPPPPAPPAPRAPPMKEASAALKEAPRPPRWDDPGAVRHIWPQIAGLAEAGVLCPYVYPREHPAGPYTTVAYEREVAHEGPFSLHVTFRAPAGVSGSWGLGCLRRYDVRRYAYLSFWALSRGGPGQRLRVRLRDAAGGEAVVEKALLKEGWQRVAIPTADFASIDLRALLSLGLVFEEGSGEADLYIDDLEFTNQ